MTSPGTTRPGFVRIRLFPLLILLSLGSGHVGAQQLTAADVERRIGGVWELAEWHFEGQVLKPPVVNGRIVFHDGQIVSIYHRDKDGTAYDIYSYGSYSLNQDIWSYGYERRLEVTRKAGASTVTQGTREQIGFAYRLDGSNLVMVNTAPIRDYQTGDLRFVFGRADFTYSEKGQVLREWHRLESGRRVQ